MRLIFFCRRYLEILRNTSFNGVSGYINFRNGTSRKALVEIQQFVYDENKKQASYATVGLYDSRRPEGQ